MLIGRLQSMVQGLWYCREALRALIHTALHMHTNNKYIYSLPLNCSPYEFKLASSTRINKCYVMNKVD